MVYIQGTDNNETLVGTDGNDQIEGWYGSDIIYGLAGDDLIGCYDGDGDPAEDDEIHGGDGNDYLTAPGIIYGDAGDDYIGGCTIAYGGPGNDYIALGVSGQVLSGRAYGEAGNDIIRGSEGNDLIFGGPGNDSGGGSGGNDVIWGGEDDDKLAGDLGNDTVNGEAGNDDIAGGSGNDSLDGGIGNDRLSGTDGDDTLRAGEGDDVLYGDIPFFDDLSGNDTLYGDNGNDFLTGDKGDDILWGGAGNDIIHGGWGDVESPKTPVSGGFEDRNELHGDEGNDILIGGQGDDQLVGCGTQAGVGEIDELTGQAGKDTFVLGEQGNVYYDDGVASNSVSQIPASRFGLQTRTSHLGWRNVEGSNFHLGIDYGSGGTPKKFKAGITGEVVSKGGLYNTIKVRLANGNTIEYLHASKILVKTGDFVTPNTILGVTGGTGPKTTGKGNKKKTTKSSNAYPIHLHVQAHDSHGKLIDPDAALAGADNLYPKSWCQGLGDYALIKDFKKTDDTIQLLGTGSQYYLKYFGPKQSLVSNGFIPAGTAIIFETDGRPGLSYRDELVGVIAGQNVTNFGAGFSFV